MSTINYTTEIKEFISKRKSKDELQDFFAEKNIKPSDYEDFKRLIIFAIEQDASTDIVEFLINQRKEKNANFEIIDKYEGSEKIIN